MTFKKRVLKFIIWILLIGVCGSFLGYYYLRKYMGEFCDGKRIDRICNKSKVRKELPERFYQLYEQEHPNILSYSLNQADTAVV